MESLARSWSCPWNDGISLPGGVSSPVHVALGAMEQWWPWQGWGCLDSLFQPKQFHLSLILKQLCPSHPSPAVFSIVHLSRRLKTHWIPTSTDISTRIFPFPFAFFLNSTSPYNQFLKHSFFPGFPGGFFWGFRWAEELPMPRWNAGRCGRSRRHSLNK